MQNEETKQEAPIQIAKLVALRETLEALTKQQRAESMSVIPDLLQEDCEKARRSAQVAVMKAIEILSKNIWSDQRHQSPLPNETSLDRLIRQEKERLNGAGLLPD